MPDTKKLTGEERIQKLMAAEIAKRDAADQDSKMTPEQKAFARMIARETAAAVVRELQAAEDDEPEEEEKPRDFLDEIFGPRKAKK